MSVEPKIEFNRVWRLVDNMHLSNAHTKYMYDFKVRFILCNAIIIE